MPLAWWIPAAFPCEGIWTFALRPTSQNASLRWTNCRVCVNQAIHAHGDSTTTQRGMGAIAQDSHDRERRRHIAAALPCLRRRIAHHFHAGQSYGSRHLLCLLFRCDTDRWKLFATSLGSRLGRARYDSMTMLPPTESPRSPTVAAVQSAFADRLMSLRWFNLLR